MIYVLGPERVEKLVMVCQIFKRSAAGRTLDISGFSSSVRVMLEMDWFSAGENVKK